MDPRWSLAAGNGVVPSDWQATHKNVHARKIGRFKEVVPEDQRQILHEIGAQFGVQLPDLFVVSRDGKSFSFCEVKGPTDGTLNSPNQRASRQAIRDCLDVRVEVIKVALVSGAHS